MVIRRELFEITRSVFNTFNFLVNFSLLKEKKYCKVCRKHMVLQTEKIADGLVWRCIASKCSKRELSVRKNSPLFGLKILLKKIIEIVYEWSINTKIKDIKRETEVYYASINIVFWPFRKKIGSSNCIIEVDETAITKRKFERGRLVSTLWCVSGVCRTHKKRFFELKRVRNQDTLHEIVQKHVVSGVA